MPYPATTICFQLSACRISDTRLNAMLFLVALSGILALAAQHAPDFTISTRAIPKGLEISAHPPDGNHFNIQAPMELIVGSTPKKKVKPASATEKEVRFVLTPNPQSVAFSVSIFLCDDKKTYCEKHIVHSASQASPQVTPHGEPLPTPSAPTSPTSPISTPKAPKQSHGFILNRPEEALTLAQQTNKPLLIDFYGIWCPPCNMLDEEVFSTKDFEKASSQFVRLKLDADSDISWDLKSRYKVGGYPTVLFAASNGEEISRIVGFLSKAQFLAKIDEAWNARHDTFPVLQSKADMGDIGAAEKVGLTYLERREYEPAMKYLRLAPSRKEEFAQAEIGFWEGKTLKSPESEVKLIEALERAIQASPNTPESIDRRMKLAQRYEDKKLTEQRKNHLEAAIRVVQQLIQTPDSLKGKDFTVADLWAMTADVQESLGLEANARESWAKAAAEYRKKAASPRERGHNLELAYCLWKSGNSAAAEAIYRSLEKAYPEEFTFYYGHASMNLELKKLREAEEQASRSHQYSYGDNRLRAAQLLAKIYKAQGKKQEALALIDKTLSEAKIPKDDSIRTHRYLNALKKLKDSL